MIFNIIAHLDDFLKYRIFRRLTRRRIVMIAVISGDVIGSREGDVSSWMEVLKKILSAYGKSPAKWEIYRGDSFQCVIPVELALDAAFKIKAQLKSATGKDVRLAIGIGDETFKADHVTQSNGSAYVRSGQALDLLKRSSMAINSGQAKFDQNFNIMLSLMTKFADGWTPTVAEVVLEKLRDRSRTQVQIAKGLGKAQSTISAAFSRGAINELIEVLEHFEREIKELHD